MAWASTRAATTMSRSASTAGALPCAATTSTATANPTACAARCPAQTRLVDDLADVIDSTRARMEPGTPLMLLGHSMGGLVAASFVALGQVQVDALVLSSPALDPGSERLPEVPARGAAAHRAQPTRGQRAGPRLPLARPGGGRGLPGRSARARPHLRPAGALHGRRRPAGASSARRAGRCRPC